MTRPAPDRPEPAPARDPRRLILFGIVSSIAAVLVVWLLYTVRSTLVLVYISGMLAMGISPLVRMIERQRAIPIGTRVPRWVAILIIYAAIIGVLVLLGRLVVPPLIDQAEELWRTLPDQFAQAQRALVRIGILRRADHDRRGRATGTGHAARRPRRRCSARYATWSAAYSASSRCCC